MGQIEIPIKDEHKFGLTEFELQNRELKKTKKTKSCGTIVIEMTESTAVKRWIRRRRTPLHEAARLGEHTKLEFLIEEAGWAKAVDDKDPDRGWTALHFAVFKGCKHSVRILLQHSCNVNAKDDNGWTPLMEAAWSGRCKSLAWMLAKKAKPDLQDKDGWTALHAAAYQGNFGCATVLVNFGADRILPDNSGQNAAMVAEMRRFVALAHLIQFGTQDARRRKPVHAAVIFGYALLMGTGSVLVIAGVLAGGFSLDTTIKVRL